ncbi:MAG: hypothetical protein [Caudoviricetes sp.]|nr:MAG: hypothetical protein [Caudoviricetes sp.]
MKLVDILARELAEWPEGVECLSQLKGSGYIVSGNGFDGRVFDALPIASETLVAGAIVTRAQWQAAVDALSDPLPALKDPLPMPNVAPPKHEAIDWSKAPEGATHYFSEAGSGKWRDLSGEFWRWWSEEDLEWKYGSGGRSAKLLNRTDLGINERPGYSKWNGEGLPPVGTVCECKVSAGAEWVECEVVAHKVHYGATYAIAFVDENTVMLSAGIRFRPTRTPEQIAAEEREKAIEELRQLLSCVACDDYHAAVAMIDAGYRKQVQP